MLDPSATAKAADWVSNPPPAGAMGIMRTCGPYIENWP